MKKPLNDEFKISAWNEATRNTVANARACLPNALPAIYLPMLEAATRTASQPAELRLRCEELLLNHMYQRLSSADTLCTAFAHGMRMCAHYITTVTDRGARPADFARLGVSAYETVCRDAIADDPTSPSERFRHLFSAGTACLRRNTVNALIESFIE